ncbi:alpha/beta hydrolase fold domain-containing protein [Streptomyces ziwulingensis]|uniref:alpha/beta hydrolase fold domain-containing protein n=1 Tax=Streptomyces ziwulingensis TaxID=1045501 RepID=UPI0031F0653F
MAPFPSADRGASDVASRRVAPVDGCGCLSDHVHGLHRHACPAAGCAENYRRAPEHPFPAAVGDGCTALRWPHEHAGELVVDPSRIGAMGDSAGGGLASPTSPATCPEGGNAPALDLRLDPHATVIFAEDQGPQGSVLALSQRLGDTDAHVGLELA